MSADVVPLCTRCKAPSAAFGRVAKLILNPDSTQDSDLNGVVAVRYTGGARMLLLIELGRQGKSRMRVKVPSSARRKSSPSAHFAF